MKVSWDDYSQYMENNKLFKPSTNLEKLENDGQNGEHDETSWTNYGHKLWFHHEKWVIFSNGASSQAPILTNKDKTWVIHSQLKSIFNGTNIWTTSINGVFWAWQHGIPRGLGGNIPWKYAVVPWNAILMVWLDQQSWLVGAWGWNSPHLEDNHSPPGILGVAWGRLTRSSIWPLWIISIYFFWS